MKFVGWTRSARVTTTCPPVCFIHSGSLGWCRHKNPVPLFFIHNMFCNLFGHFHGTYLCEMKRPLEFAYLIRNHDTTPQYMAPFSLMRYCFRMWSLGWQPHTPWFILRIKNVQLSQNWIVFVFKRYVLPLCSTFEKTIWRPHPHLKS